MMTTMIQLLCGEKGMKIVDAPRQVGIGADVVRAENKGAHHALVLGPVPHASQKPTAGYNIRLQDLQ